MEDEHYHDASPFGLLARLMDRRRHRERLQRVHCVCRFAVKRQGRGGRGGGEWMRANVFACTAQFLRSKTSQQFVPYTTLSSLLLHRGFVYRLLSLGTVTWCCGQSMLLLLLRTIHGQATPTLPRCVCLSCCVCVGKRMKSPEKLQGKLTSPPPPTTIPLFFPTADG